jgi:MOSC domain-containing protein YiiM/ferredoxin-NADP reductase
MARLVSVNVGMPRDVEWRDRTVHTGIWKDPVQGRVRVGKLNVEGDGQGDLAGHGGEQRAVFVYQIESYRHWQKELGRTDFVHGQFGENFTIDGLPDDEVCIGDRYRIGNALFEVTQPRVTCFRVGIRTNEPRMPALLTSSGRPGFYFRVIEEGDVGAGDAIVLVDHGPQRMTVAEINALLYSPDHPREKLVRALRIPALSPGWRWSFNALLRSHTDSEQGAGNAGLMPAAAARTAKPGFRPMRIARIVRECADVISLVLQPADRRADGSADGSAVTPALPGQFIVLRMRPPAGPLLYRSYSLSGPVSSQEYRISVKIEPNGAAGKYLDTLQTGDVLEASEPRGSFTLQPGDGPVVLLSAGIGATPVLAMLHALAAQATSREIWWLHSARNVKVHAFAAEARQLIGGLARAKGRVWYSRPEPADRLGTDYDIAGRMTIESLQQLAVPREGDFYICGPSAFLDDMSTSLLAWGVPAERIHSERFSGGPSLTPGVVGALTRAPHQPEGAPGTGPLVSFARSGIAVRWRAQDRNILELAEACDVPVRWSCRTGVCHNCESGLISGSVGYEPAPLDAPANGNVLICCARPQADVVIDI